MIKIDRRNYSVDLLRILSMFGIVVLHVINHGIFKGDKFYSEVSYWPISLLNSVSLCAVNCFALISGYISSCWTINFKKYMKLYCQVWFYSVGISLVFFLKGENITNAEWLTACCPMYREMYWYFSAYTVLVIGAPLLHSVLNFESKDKIRIFIWLVILSFSFLGAIPGLSGFSYRIFRDGYNGTWLVFLYIVGGFCAKYGFRELCFWGRYVKNKYSIYYLAWGILVCVSFSACYYLVLQILYLRFLWVKT